MCDEEMVCSRCGNPFGITRYGSIGQYCSEDCEQKAIILRETKQKNIKDAQQKHEEIKRMAEKIVIRTACQYRAAEYKDMPSDEYITGISESAWFVAEIFYKFAKKKEEVNDGMC